MNETNLSKFRLLQIYFLWHMMRKFVFSPLKWGPKIKKCNPWDESIKYEAKRTKIRDAYTLNWDPSMHDFCFDLKSLKFNILELFRRKKYTVGLFLHKIADINFSLSFCFIKIHILKWHCTAPQHNNKYAILSLHHSIITYFVIRIDQAGKLNNKEDIQLHETLFIIRK